MRYTPSSRNSRPKKRSLGLICDTEQGEAGNSSIEFFLSIWQHRGSLRLDISSRKITFQVPTMLPIQIPP